MTPRESTASKSINLLPQDGCSLGQHLLISHSASWSSGSLLYGTLDAAVVILAPSLSHSHSILPGIQQSYFETNLTSFVVGVKSSYPAATLMDSPSNPVVLNLPNDTTL